MDGIWFPARTETEGETARHGSTVRLLSPLFFGKHFQCKGHYLDLIWVAGAAQSLMKSAWNPFLGCPLLSGGMMDGPFYSLFHLLCCSKLYFQGAFTWNIHFGVTWLFIRGKAHTLQGCCYGSGGWWVGVRVLEHTVPLSVLITDPLQVVRRVKRADVLLLSSMFAEPVQVFRPLLMRLQRVNKRASTSSWAQTCRALRWSRFSRLVKVEKTKRRDARGTWRELWFFSHWFIEEKKLLWASGNVP